MIKSYKEIFALFLAFFGCLDCCFAGFPPVEILADLKEYKISSAELRCDMPRDDTGLRSEIKRVYSSLYSDVSIIDSLDLGAIRSNYQKFVTLKFELGYRIVRVSFNVKEFVKAFSFDERLVRDALKKDGFIPLVVEYSVSCTMLSSNSTSTDKTIHDIVFDSFYGGNLILKENSSKVFMHVQDKLRGNPGQMILTDQKEEAKRMLATF